MTLKSKSNWIFPEKVKDDILSFLLQSRSVSDEYQFLHPSLDKIPPSTKLYDSTNAAKEIVQAIEGNKKIIIHGDFDADGISSVSILWEFLFKEVGKHLGRSINVIPYIPGRIDQGYGLTESSLNDMLSMNANLVVSVDCGVRDKDLIQKYRDEKGVQFVITDHHQPPDDILDNLDYTLVHPMYPGHEYSDVNICGAFVTFLLIQSIKKELKMDYSITPDTRGLDLVALATVTDLMPLLGINRSIVSFGIEQIKKGERVGLNELISISGVNKNEIDSYHLGYILGPRINAAGRIGSPLDAVKLLVSEKIDVCKNIANELNETNYQRQYMTQNGIDEAERIIGDSYTDKLIFVVGDSWHEGIVGLIAGKLNEKYHKPVLVATRGKEGIRGSARSIEGFDITKALTECSKYLSRYGGHQQAAGFTIKRGKEKEFSDCIHSIAQRDITDKMLVQDIYIDLLLDSEDITISLVNTLDMLKPFGYGNRKPVIGMKNLVVVGKQIMGKLGNHMKLVCKGSGTDLITLVMFNCDEDIEEILIDSSIDVIGNVGINSFNGNKEIQFLVKEWRFTV